MKRSVAEIHPINLDQVGASRTIAGTVSALVAAYLDPQSKSSPFKTGAPETQRTRGSQLGSRHTIAAIGRRRPLGHAAHGSDHERRGPDRDPQQRAERQPRQPVGRGASP